MFWQVPDSFYWEDSTQCSISIFQFYVTHGNLEVLFRIMQYYMAYLCLTHLLLKAL